ncbi:hypothetical protein RSK20926_08137 [Roseobacter sp. SK209-2-6]|uniref:globin domain-containing protein n=1 Tax=Roseobacter sp. SK209-2-6 TaxID=388739 RepID=UPI0000F3D08A|nr:hypothetical protein RSK20926_08137 [Roseobacter sp. SK209-2-6]
MDISSFVPTFYQTFFSICPSARALFPDDMLALEEKMLASFTHLAESVEGSARLDKLLSALGEKHQNMEVSDLHFEGFVTSFIETLATALGPEWNNECEQAWQSFLTHVADKMNFSISPH